MKYDIICTICRFLLWKMYTTIRSGLIMWEVLKISQNEEQDVCDVSSFAWSGRQNMPKSTVSLSLQLHWLRQDGRVLNKLPRLVSGQQGKFQLKVNLSSGIRIGVKVAYKTAAMPSWRKTVFTTSNIVGASLAFARRMIMLDYGLLAGNRMSFRDTDERTGLCIFMFDSEPSGIKPESVIRS